MTSEQTPEEPRRRRSPLAVASVAAAVLIAGGGGAYFAANASDGGGRSDSGAPAGDGTPPPLVLDGHTEGVAPGEPNPNGARYRASGELPNGPGSAPVYRPQGEVSAEQVTRLADALKVSGTPRSDGTNWTVGKPQDGPVLTVTRQAPGSWTFSAFKGGSADDCKLRDERCYRPSIVLGAGQNPVSEATAKAAAAPVLKAAGQGDAEVDATQTTVAMRMVNADPKVGGLPTYGWSTGIQVGPDGQLAGGSGQLAKPVKGATYPVISAEKTLALLNKSATGDGRVGIGGCASAVPHDDPAIAPGEGKDQACPPDTGSTAPKPEPVTVSGAVFGLAVHFEEGRQTLVPSWLFAVKPAGAEKPFTITHPAVDPKFLGVPQSSTVQPSQPPTSGQPGDTPPDAPKHRSVKVEAYSTDGKSLTVKFWGGACNEYSARAKETGDQVQVTVDEAPMKKGTHCIMIAKELTETVSLEKAVGDREVVGSDGAVVPRK
ncbi:hypothetical protein P8605_13895 [Streptomyces sp. T-3]|nr:hypothetical protein [Streptomyces sp. T-3]